MDGQRLFSQLASATVLLTLAKAASFAAAQPASAAGGLTRTEVKAEEVRARQAGEKPVGELGVPEKPFKSTRTRAERKAETKDAAAHGEIPAGGETYAPNLGPKSKLADSRKRADVKAEARQANKNGDTRLGQGYPEKTR